MFYTVHGSVNQIDTSSRRTCGHFNVWFLTEGRNVNDVRSRGRELLHDYCDRENGMLPPNCDFRMSPGEVAVERMIGASVRDGAIVMVKTDESIMRSPKSQEPQHSMGKEFGISKA